MPQRRQSKDTSAQHRVAQKYRRLGYEVQENPEAVSLPEFMQDVRPDIVATSKLDNVVVEIKNRSILKGSNNLTRIAERVSEHPDWRLELVVLPANKSETRLPFVATYYDNLLGKALLATKANISETVYTYLANILVGQAHDIATRYNVRVRGKTDRELFLDLSFKGVIPEETTEECLSTLAKRNDLARAFDEAPKPSYEDLSQLLKLCRHLEELS